MILMSFNCRGLGSPVKHRIIQQRVQKEQIDILFLQETKFTRFDPQFGRTIWHSDHYDCVHVNANGRSGGILSIWDINKFFVSHSITGNGFVLIKGVWAANNIPCAFINIYAPASTSERKILWDEVSSHIQSFNGGICVTGDFNCVLQYSERSGISPYFAGMDDFRQFVSSNGLQDLPLANRKFTWQSSSSSAKSRLGRFLVNADMAATIGHCTQLAIQRSISDHCAVVLKPISSDWGPAPFRTLNSWISHPEFKSTVKDIWSSLHFDGWKGFCVKEKLKHLRKGLQQWNKDSFGDFNSKISAVLCSIQSLDLKAESFDLSEDEIKVKKDEFILLWDLLKQRERIDCQKARSKWISHGDCNSRYFHSLMRSRKRKNLITGLQHNDSWVEEPNSVKSVIRDHFQESFKEGNHSRPTLNPAHFKKISAADRLYLETDFKIEEIREAVSEGGSDKAPGPDDFSFSILNCIWEIIEVDVVDFLREFQSSGKLVKGLNSTFIVLIPKVSNPTSLDEYRSISLIGCLYKILAKLLSIRLRKVIH